MDFLPFYSLLNIAFISLKIKAFRKISLIIIEIEKRREI